MSSMLIEVCGVGNDVHPPNTDKRSARITRLTTNLVYFVRKKTIKSLSNSRFFLRICVVVCVKERQTKNRTNVCSDARLDGKDSIGSSHFSTPNVPKEISISSGAWIGELIGMHAHNVRVARRYPLLYSVAKKIQLFAESPPPPSSLS